MFSWPAARETPVRGPRSFCDILEPMKPLLALCLLLLAGCTSYGPEELDRLTKEDPNFKQMIAERDRMNGEIGVIKGEMLRRKRVMDAEVGRLRAEFDLFAREQNRKVEQYRSVIETSRNVLRRDVETSAARLEAKEAELDRLRASSGEVDKVLKQSKDIKLSSSEREKWEERRLMISEKIRPLEDDILELKASIRLNKRKISFLK